MPHLPDGLNLYIWIITLVQKSDENQRILIIFLRPLPFVGLGVEDVIGVVKHIYGRDYQNCRRRHLGKHKLCLLIDQY